MTGIREFIQAVAQAIGWTLLIITFAIYVTFRSYFESLPGFIVWVGSIVLATISIFLILYRNSSRIRTSTTSGVQEKIIRITPMDELKHDILGLLTFALCIVWIWFTGYDINGNDVAQAAIAYAGVSLVRRIYREKIY